MIWIPNILAIMKATQVLEDTLADVRAQLERRKQAEDESDEDYVHVGAPMSLFLLTAA